MGQIVEHAPRELTSFLYALARGRSKPVLHLLNVYAADDPEAGVAALTPMLEIGRLLDQQAALVPYPAILPAHDAAHHGGATNPLVSNGFAEHLILELSEKLAAGLERNVAPWLAIRAVGGAVNDVEPQATALAHRHHNFNVSSLGGGANEEAFHGHWGEVRPHLNGLYLSFETDERPERLSDAFPARRSPG